MKMVLLENRFLEYGRKVRVEGEKEETETPRGGGRVYIS